MAVFDGSLSTWAVFFVIWIVIFQAIQPKFTSLITFYSIVDLANVFVLPVLEVYDGNTRASFHSMYHFALVVYSLKLFTRKDYDTKLLLYIASSVCNVALFFYLLPQDSSKLALHCAANMSANMFWCFYLLTDSAPFLFIAASQGFQFLFIELRNFPHDPTSALSQYGIESQSSFDGLLVLAQLLLTYLMTAVYIYPRCCAVLDKLVRDGDYKP